MNRVDLNYCSAGRGTSPGRPTFADCKACLKGQDDGSVILPPPTQ
jgi:hypothetical protein